MTKLPTFDLLTPANLNQKSGYDGSLQLSPITIPEDYRKEWNENSHDFVVLTRNGELISNSLYRVGGIGGGIKQDYFMLIKHVESVYDYDFIKKVYPKKSNKELELQRKHLEGRWCIIDKNGVEKVEFKEFDSPYLSGGVIYSLNNNYYNIETGYCYGRGYNSIKSDSYVFLDNNYDKDESKSGVIKINKKDGSWELFK